MFRWWVRAILLAAGAGMLAGQPETVIKVDVNLVRVLATVKNRAGQLVGALNKDDFEIYDNGALQEIAGSHWSRERRRNVKSERKREWFHKWPIGRKTWNL